MLVAPCVVYNKQRDPLDKMSFEMKRLADLAASNRFPCFTCDESFTSVTRAAGHMLECNHSPITRAKYKERSQPPVSLTTCGGIVLFLLPLNALQRA